MWKLQDFLPLRFYVKSILENREVAKLHFCHFRSSEFCSFGQLQFTAFKNCKNSQKSKFRTSKCDNLADFETLDTRKLCFHVKSEWQNNSTITKLKIRSILSSILHKYFFSIGFRDEKLSSLMPKLFTQWNCFGFELLKVRFTKKKRKKNCNFFLSWVRILSRGTFRFFL